MNAFDTHALFFMQQTTKQKQKSPNHVSKNLNSLINLIIQSALIQLHPPWKWT